MLELSLGELFLICLLNYMTFFFPIYSLLYMPQRPCSLVLCNTTETRKLYSAAFIPVCQMVKWLLLQDSQNFHALTTGFTNCVICVSWNEKQGVIEKGSATCLLLLALCLCCDASVLHSMLIWSRPPICYLNPTGISPGFTCWMWSLCKSRYLILFYTPSSFKLLFKSQILLPFPFLWGCFTRNYPQQLWKNL